MTQVALVKEYEGKLKKAKNAKEFRCIRQAAIRRALTEFGHDALREIDDALPDKFQKAK